MGDEEWFKLKYHPEDATKRKEDCKGPLEKRIDVFIKFMDELKFNSISIDGDQSDTLIKLLDSVVIYLEGGSELDLQILEQEAQEKAEEKKDAEAAKDAEKKEASKETSDSKEVSKTDEAMETEVKKEEGNVNGTVEESSKRKRKRKEYDDESASGEGSDSEPEEPPPGASPVPKEEKDSNGVKDDKDDTNGDEAK